MLNQEEEPLTNASESDIDGKSVRTTKRSGICAPFQWFKQSPLERWPFAALLLFGLIAPVWILVRITGSLTGDILSGLCALILSFYAANHLGLLLGLKETVDKFGRCNREMKIENGQLKRQVSRLERANGELTEVSEWLTSAARKYKQNISVFKTLDERLSKLAGDNIEGLKKLQKMSKTVQESIEKELVQHQRDIVFRVQETMEFGDDKEGMEKHEYQRFVAALPLAYQKVFTEEKFDEMCGDDKIMDLKEFTKLCDEISREQALKN